MRPFHLPQELEKIEPHARTLELPLLARSGKVWQKNFFFLSEAQDEGVSFRCAFAPLPKRGNFGRPSTRLNYSSSYPELGTRIG